MADIACFSFCPPEVVFFSFKEAAVLKFNHSRQKFSSFLHCKPPPDLSVWSKKALEKNHNTLIGNLVLVIRWPDIDGPVAI